VVINIIFQLGAIKVSDNRLCLIGPLCFDTTTLNLLPDHRADRHDTACAWTDSSKACNYLS